MKIGYTRVSTLDQNLELQTDALEKAGCEKIFTDRASGAKADRQGLSEAIEFCRKGDSLVVWKLDRLGRSLKHLIETINQLHSKAVGFVSVQESIDTKKRCFSVANGWLGIYKISVESASVLRPPKESSKVFSKNLIRRL